MLPRKQLMSMHSWPFYTHPCGQLMVTALLSFLNEKLTAIICEVLVGGRRFLTLRKGTGHIYVC